MPTLGTTPPHDPQRRLRDVVPSLPSTAPSRLTTLLSHDLTHRHPLANPYITATMGVRGVVVRPQERHRSHYPFLSQSTVPGPGNPPVQRCLQQLLVQGLGPDHV